MEKKGESGHNFGNEGTWMKTQKKEKGERPFCLGGGVSAFKGKKGLTIEKNAKKKKKKKIECPLPRGEGHPFLGGKGARSGGGGQALGGKVSSRDRKKKLPKYQKRAATMERTGEKKKKQRLL